MGSGVNTIRPSLIIHPVLMKCITVYVPLLVFLPIHANLMKGATSQILFEIDQWGVNLNDMQ